MTKRTLCIVLIIAAMSLAAEPQIQPTLSVRAWSYTADQALSVQVGNCGERSVSIGEISFGGNEWVTVGRDVESCRTLTIQQRVDSEPCAFILKTGQGRFIFELDPRLRR